MVGGEGKGWGQGSLGNCTSIITWLIFSLTRAFCLGVIVLNVCLSYLLAIVIFWILLDQIFSLFLLFPYCLPCTGILQAPYPCPPLVSFWLVAKYFLQAIWRSHSNAWGDGARVGCSISTKLIIYLFFNNNVAMCISKITQNHMHIIVCTCPSGQKSPCMCPVAFVPHTHILHQCWPKFEVLLE